MILDHQETLRRPRPGKERTETHPRGDGQEHP